uniref:Endoplasmic reticulum lectin 1 n=1 Tax=Cacopsylla melanoneura TaxID=428564 RepID=A0A8D8X9J6_9HEMI
MKSSDTVKKFVCLCFLGLISICCACFLIWSPAEHIPEKGEIQVDVGSKETTMTTTTPPPTRKPPPPPTAMPTPPKTTKPPPTTTTTTPMPTTATTPVPRKHRPLPNTSRLHPGTVLSFLAGDYCLQGSDNLYRFEFCYGKRVMQFRDSKATIWDTFRYYQYGERAQSFSHRLGEFDLEAHKQWVKDHPYKLPQPLEKATYVSYFYSKGDKCDPTGKPREVEVKLKCVSSAEMSVSLIEPFICRYVLQVESFMFCELLPYADEFGIFNDVPDDLLFLKIRPNDQS